MQSENRFGKNLTVLPEAGIALVMRFSDLPDNSKVRSQSL